MLTLRLLTASVRPYERHQVTEPGAESEATRHAIFQAALNRQGHPFQYAVIRRAHVLNDEGRSPWVFEASEFPVEVQEYHTRIDFILSQWNEVLHGNEVLRGPFQFLVAECKRANPSLHDWLFARAPYVRRGSVSRDILVERVRKEGTELTASVGRLHGSENIYHVAVEVKGAAKGDASGSGRGGIEDAATQVIRGVNGLIECFSKHPRYVTENFPVSFIPVIFTTAKIWATDVDIAADVATGRVEIASTDVVEKPWLWLQYHVSPGLQHTVDRQVPKEEPLLRAVVGDLLELEYARTIAVVGVGGIDEFFAIQRWGSGL